MCPSAPVKQPDIDAVQVVWKKAPLWSLFPFAAESFAISHLFAIASADPKFFQDKITIIPMKLFKRFYQSNRHVKLAVILAPLLAIGAYITTGILLEEKVQEQPGADKAMALQPDCHLLTKVCELLHREIAANITIEEKEGRQLVYLATSIPIRGALLSVGDEKPSPMLSRGTAKGWVLELQRPVVENDVIRLVLAGDKNRYFAEIPANR